MGGVLDMMMMACSIFAFGDAFCVDNISYWRILSASLHDGEAPSFSDASCVNGPIIGASLHDGASPSFSIMFHAGI